MRSAVVMVKRIVEKLFIESSKVICRFDGLAGADVGDETWQASNDEIFRKPKNILPCFDES